MKKIIAILTTVTMGLSFSVMAADLEPCPDSPNCASSQELVQDRHYIEPWTFTAPVADVQAALQKYLQNQPRVAITTNSAGNIKAEFTSKLFGWVDDMDVVIDAPNQRVDWRSASRSGYWDLGANRRRLEAMRRWLNKHFTTESK